MKHCYSTKLYDELSDADIMTVSTPCQGRTTLRSLNERKFNRDPNAKYEGDELFLLQQVRVAFWY